MWESFRPCAFSPRPSGTRFREACATPLLSLVVPDLLWSPLRCHLVVHVSFVVPSLSSVTAELCLLTGLLTRSGTYGYPGLRRAGFSLLFERSGVDPHVYARSTLVGEGRQRPVLPGSCRPSGVF